MMWFWMIFIGIFVFAMMGVDVAKNPQSWRNIGLRIGDGCRDLWFWPGRLSDTRAYHGRHRHGDPLPSFMHSWRPTRSWSTLRSGPAEG